MTAPGSVRRSTFPQPNDTWETIAEREFPDDDPTTTVSQLQSWNMHVFMRRNDPAQPILPSDVIFLEAPRSQ